MTTVRCEPQTRFLLLTQAAVHAVCVYVVVELMAIGGPTPFLVLIGAAMTVWVGVLCYGVLESFAAYSWDETRVVRRSILHAAEVAWDDVTDLRIRRSTGDATIYLTGRDGESVKIDFQQLGHRGRELMGTLLRRLGPLVDRKTEAVARGRRFRHRYVGFAPMPGSVAVEGDELRGGPGRGSRVRLDGIRQVRVKEVQRLTSTQEYTVLGNSGRVSFRSTVEDAPLLVRFLRSRVPEDRWVVTRSSALSGPRLAPVVMLVVALLAAVVLIGEMSGDLAVEAALARGSALGEATVVDVQSGAESRGPHRIAYEITAPGADSFPGEGVVVGRAPAVGERMAVVFNPDEPYFSRPGENAAFRPVRALPLAIGLVLLVAVVVPWTIATLAFRVREEPFLDWMA